MRKFITPVSMKVTEKQYIEDLEVPLIEMGYDLRLAYEFDKYPFLYCNYFHKGEARAGTEVYIDTSISIDDYNPKLYLALAAMTNVEEGVKGEYWKFTGSFGGNFTKNKLYKANKSINNFGAIIDDIEMPNGYGYGYINHKYFTKATKDEIINHLSYSNIGYTTNYPIFNFSSRAWDTKNKHSIITNKTTENMRISTKGAQRIINSACPDWRDSLAKKWGANIVKNEPISISTEEYKKMRAACTPTQNDLFDEIFGKYETYPEVGTVCWVWSICRSNAHLAIHKGNGEYKICFNNGLGAVRQKNYEVLTENNK